MLLGTSPGKPLGSFGSQLEPQNATNIAWNVPGTFHPRFRGTLGRNFGACVEPKPSGILVGCLVSALPARWSMNNICEQDLFPRSAVKCTLCGCPLPMPENTRPNPPRRVKIPASSYSPAREQGIQGHSFFYCFHVLCVPFSTLTNICEQDLCLLSIALSIDVRFLCQITLGGIRQDD